MKIPGKVYVVTGAGNGIGREVALQLIAAGGRVAGVDVNAANLAATAALCTEDGTFSQHPVDITEREAVHALPNRVRDAHGQVDGLINVAGVIQQFVRVLDLDYAEIDKVMKVNFWGTMHMVKAFVPELVNRPEASLVNVASMGAYAPVPGQAVYGASKAAVTLLTEALYAELMNTPVSVTVIFPGAIGTDIAANSGVSMAAGANDAEAPAFKTTSVDKAAAVLIEAMVNKRFRATIGSDAAAMDRLARLNPRAATRMIASRMGGLLERSG